MTQLLDQTHGVPAGALFDRPFEAVLFDMDGTLIDSVSSVERSWLRWAAEYRVDPQRLRGWHGVPARQIVAALLPVGEVDSAVRRIESIEIHDVEGIVV